MLYIIKWIFCWVFLFRAPCKHNYTAWHIIEDSTTTYNDMCRRGTILVKRSCRSCYSEEKREHTTILVQREETYKRLKTALRKYVLDVYGITNHKEEE